MRKFAFALIVFCFLFSSCSNNVIEDKSTLEIEQKPIINDLENAEGLRVVSITNAEYYLYKMEPLWISTDGVPYGSTVGLSAPTKPDGTSIGDEYKDCQIMLEIRTNVTGSDKLVAYTVTKEQLDLGEIESVFDDFIKLLDPYLDHNLPF